MITIDTSAILALFNSRDMDHEAVVRVFRSHGDHYVIPAQVMAEMCFMINSRLGNVSVLRLLDNLRTGKLYLHCGEDDIARIHELVVRYADMPLGFADAAVIACAERHGGKVLTLDHRHFGVVARDADITIVP